MKYSFVLCVLTLVLSPYAVDAREAEPIDYSHLREQAMKAYRARSAERTVSLLEKFLEQYSNDAEAWYRLSVAYEWSDRFDDAIAAGERVQELGYFYRARLSYRLAQLHARTVNSEAALLWLERSLEERIQLIRGHLDI